MTDITRGEDGLRSCPRRTGDLCMNRPDTERRKELRLRVRDCLLIILSAVILAFIYKLFIVPNSFAPAGINGIATMVQYKLGFSIGYMSLLVNIPLCVFAYFTTDRRFALRTCLFCVVYSTVYLIIQNIDMSGIQYDAKGVDTVFPCMLGGIITGAINGICFRAKASTGGTDIISKYIGKKDKTLNFFYVTFALNAAVAAASLFVYAQEGELGKVLDYKPVCLCLLYSFTSSYIGNRAIQGAQRAYRYTVITSHAVEIEKEIIEKLHHTATDIRAHGAYSDTGRDVLICVINPNQMVELKEILLKYDDTFAFSEPVHETVGNFKHISKRRRAL